MHLGVAAERTGRAGGAEHDVRRHDRAQHLHRRRGARQAEIGEDVAVGLDKLLRGEGRASRGGFGWISGVCAQRVYGDGCLGGIQVQGGSGMVRQLEDVPAWRASYCCARSGRGSASAGRPSCLRGGREGSSWYNETVRLAHKACCAHTPQEAHTHSRRKVAFRTRARSDFCHATRRRFGARRPRHPWRHSPTPNKRFLGGLRERVLHELSAIALASLEREAVIEKVAAGNLWRYIACELCRDAAGGGI